MNEFPHTQTKPFKRFLHWQWMNAPKLVTRDEDLHKAIEKMETRELKRLVEEVAQNQRRPPKLLRK